MNDPMHFTFKNVVFLSVKKSVIIYILSSAPKTEKLMHCHSSVIIYGLEKLTDTGISV